MSNLRFIGTLFICFAVLIAAPVPGADFFVATDGNDDNPGTRQQPWRTVQKAANTMVAGDHVFIRQGLYIERVRPKNTGNEDNYITYEAYPGEEAVIESPNTWSSDYCFYLPDSRDLHHLRFIGLTLRNANWANFYALAGASGSKSHLILDSLTIEGGGFGVFLDGGASVSLTDCAVMNCEIHNTAQGVLVQRSFEDIRVEGNHIFYSDPPVGFPYGGHNIQCFGTGLVNTRVVIAGNHVHHAEVQGISVWYTNHVLIRGNHSHHNGATGIQIESQAGPGYTKQIVVEQNLCEHNAQTFPAETGIWVDDSSDVIVQDNVLRYNEIGLKITGSPRVLVRRNTVYKNSDETSVVSPGIAVREATDGDATADDVVIVHNTLYRNGASEQRSQVLIGLAGYLPEIQRNVFKNNISSACTAQFDLWISGLTHTLDYNTYHNASRPLAIVWQESLLNWTAYLSASGQDTHSLTSDPRFVDPGRGTFKLMADSPCRNSGGPLTTTVSAGSGTVVQVEDARYFSDGMGVVEGDRIRIGANEMATVLDVDYEVNTITVDRDLQWQTGHDVNYPYHGGAPDMGAFELGPGVRTWLDDMPDPASEPQIKGRGKRVFGE